MAGVRRNLVIRGGVDITQFSKGMDKMQKELERKARKFSAIGNKMSMALTVPIMAVTGYGIKMASDLNESINKVDVAFQNDSKIVKEWSKTTLKSFGMARQTSLEMASTFGDMGTSLGLSTGKAAEMSMSLTGLAGDLASFKNIKIDVANTALMAVYTGETESLKRLGIVMTQANLNAYAMAQGINKTMQEMSQAEQVQLRYNYVLEMTKNAQGDFARTFDSTANQARVAKESTKEITASLVNGLMPTVNQFLALVNRLADRFNSLSSGTKKFIMYSLLLTATLGPLLKIIALLTTAKAVLVGWYKAATIANIVHTATVSKETAATMAETAAKNANILTMIKTVSLYAAHKVALIASTVATGVMAGVTWAATAAQWALNVAFYASPFGWVALAVMAIVGIVVLLAKKVGGFGKLWQIIWDGIKNAFKAVVNFIIGYYNFILSGLKLMINGAISLINGFIKLANKIPGIEIKMIPKLDSSALQIPKFANGGIVYGKTIGMMGEYENARSNPEVIAPLDKLKGMLGGSGETTINFYMDSELIATKTVEHLPKILNLNV